MSIFVSILIPISISISKSLYISLHLICVDFVAQRVFLQFLSKDCRGRVGKTGGPVEVGLGGACEPGPLAPTIILLPRFLGLAPESVVSTKGTKVLAF